MKSRVLLTLAIGLLSLAIFTPSFYFTEHGTNPHVNNAFDAFWWWVVTSATVGYGDLVPLTTAGRMVAMATILCGFFVYTHAVTLIAEGTHAFMDRHKRGTAPLRWTNHIILCDYTAMADEWLHALRNDPEWSRYRVAIVTDLVQTAPYPDLGFVFGVPLNPGAMARANVSAAAHVFLFANHRFGDPDLKTFHAAKRIHNMAPGATVWVEAMDPHSDLAAQLPPEIRLMPSRLMMGQILRPEGVNLRQWIEASGK